MATKKKDETAQINKVGASLYMDKHHFETLFKAAAVAVCQDDNRPHIQCVAVYIEKDNFCLAATDGHRIHFAATTEITTFKSVFDGDPQYTIDVDLVKAWLKPHKKRARIDVVRLFNECEHRRYSFFPVMRVAEPLWSVSFTAKSMPFGVNPQFLADLAKLKTSDEPCAVTFYGNAGDRLNPIVVAAGSNVTLRYFAAIIMPCAL